MSLVFVATPTRSEVHGMFMHDLMAAIVQHMARSGETVLQNQSDGSMLPSQRAKLVLEARREGASHVLFIDSDMRFPVDTIERMLMHGKLIVGANCSKRRSPPSPTACNYDPATGEKHTVYTYPHSTGLEQVDCVGTGVLLIDMAVFDAVPAPWFLCPWVEHAQGYLGEDVYFMKLMKQRGIPVWIDHDLSKEIGHIGDFTFRHEHIWATQELEQIPVEA